MVNVGLENSIILLLFIITSICVIGYFVSPDKKFLKVLENKTPKGASSINLIGTVMYGSKPLTREQLKYYGLEPTEWHEEYYKKYGSDLRDLPFSMRKYFPQIRTKFISIFFPLIPLQSQVVFNIEDLGIEERFNAIPVELYWKQVFFILSFSYGSMLVIAILISLYF